MKTIVFPAEDTIGTSGRREWDVDHIHNMRVRINVVECCGSLLLSEMVNTDVWERG